AMLFETVAIALEVARLSRGAFDPTIGAAQQRRGFDRNYITGQQLATAAVTGGAYRDVRLDRRQRTITLRRPLLLDLGAVAKGFAIDLAALELAAFERFAVEAGGDLFVGGADEAASSWRVGIQDARGDGLLGTLTVRNRGICTSGGYERRSRTDDEHHL